MFRGEFACFPHNDSGVRHFLRFGLWICNPNSEVLELDASSRFLTLRVDSESDTIVDLPYLRDSQCLGSSPFYTRGSQFRLGPRCCSIYPVRTNCMWLDTTNTTLPDEFELHISLAGAGNLSITVTDLEPTVRGHSLIVPIVAPLTFLVIFLLCLMHVQLAKKEAMDRAKGDL